MSWYEKIKNIENIREKMQDEESRVIFDARIDYMCTRDKYAYFDKMDTIPKKWRCRELENQLKGKEKIIIIYGYNQFGKEQKRVVELCGYKVSFWCDKNLKLVGEIKEGIPVISIEELVNKYSKEFVIISSKKYNEEMRSDLRNAGFPEESMYSPKYGTLVAMTGKQYFELFEPNKDEVFVDAGAYDGGTISDYFAWGGANCRKIYSMEPLPDMYEQIKEMIREKGLQDVYIENYAAWDKEDTLQFIMADAGSKIDISGSNDNIIDVKAVDIDTLVGDENVTFIKMDIEGSELKALHGAGKCITKNKPRLAICIYHKAGDVIELADYILQLNPDYKFYIRHYATNMWETVLYAE